MKGIIVVWFSHPCLVSCGPAAQRLRPSSGPPCTLQAHLHPPNLWPHHPRICPAGAVIYGFNTSGGGIQQTWSTQVGCGGRPAALRSRLW